MAVAERRRRAVRTLHKAYALKWRFEIDRRTKIRHQKQIDEDQVQKWARGAPLMLGRSEKAGVGIV